MEPKKLSASKINPAKLLGGTSFVKNTTNIGEKLKEESITISKSDLLIIKGQVFEIKNLVTNLTTLKKKKLKTERVETEKQKFGEREKELEKKKKPEDNKIKLPEAPKLGFLDIVKRFVVNTLIGFIAVRLIKYLPKLIEVAKFVGGAMDFITDIGGKLLNGLATFVQKGYEAYDFTRNTLKSFGGDNALKLFDGFNNALEGVITAALAASFALVNMAGGGDDGKEDLTKIRGKGIGRNRRGIDPKLARRYTERYGRDVALSKFGREGVESLGGKYGRSAASNIARKGLVSLAGKSGAKAILKFTRPFLKRLPIIGAVLDFGLSVALGEDPGRAAFKAIGAGLLGTIGAALGGPFAILTGLAGGAIGDAAGAALYDLFFGKKKPDQKVAKAAGGGKPVTRAGKVVSGPKRTIKKSKAKRQISIQPTQLKPGADIGGEKNIEKVFPKNEDKSKISPLDYIEQSYKNTSQDRLFGPLLNLQTKSLVGQKPNKVDYLNAAQGLSNWMTLTFSDEILRTSAVYAAGGGEIDAEMLSKKSGDMTDAIARSLEDSISKRMDDNIQDLMKQMMLKGIEPEDKNNQKAPSPDIETEAGTTGGGTADTSLNPYRRAFLDTLAFAEGTANYPNTGYNTMFTGKQFSGYKDHPRQIQVSGRYRSDAAGRYQFLSTTWDGLGLPDFSPANQDKGALKLLAPHVLQAIDKGDFATAFHGARKTWASLPGAGYGQPEKKMKTLVGYANNRLQKYKKGEIGKPIVDNISLEDIQDVKGYRVTRGGSTIKNYSDLPPHHTYQSTSDGRRVQDFTLYKGDKFVDIPVPSPVTGKVSWVGNAGGGGNWVEIQSREGKVELGHFNKISARVGQNVQAFRSILGLQGYTGRVSPSGPDGTHVHIQAPDSVIGRYVNTLAKGSRFHGGFIPKDAKYFLHKGEFVVDKDSVDTVGLSLIAAINSIENKTQLKQKVGSLINHLSYIADYEPGGQQEIEVEVPEPQIISVPMPVPIAGGTTMISGFSSGEDYAQELYSHG